MRAGSKSWIPGRASLATVVALILVRAASSFAVPPGFSNEVVVPGITTATTIAFLPDGRMLVGELTGAIWVVQPGASSPDPTPFLQLDYTWLYGEQGVMDVLPDPNFAVNQYYYVFYTHGSSDYDNRNRLSRFTASGNGTVAGSEVVLWQDELFAELEHHAGGIAFGNDGKLYFTYGDEFIAENSQLLTTFRGKLLRINPDGTVPTDNPFYDGAGPNKDAIWAYGLRNPYRISIDAVTGRLFIGDVGSSTIEEINLGVRGANYGWPLCEGDCAEPGMTNSIHSYPHLGGEAAVTGGFVYRGTQFPVEYRGNYFFADYPQNWIKRMTFDASGNVTGVFGFEPLDGSADGPYGDPVKLIQGPDGSLYYVDIGFNGQYVPNEAAIRRIRYTQGNQPPVALASADPLSGPAPLLVSFSSAGSFDPEGLPLSYSWTFGDGASSTQADPDHTYVAEGPYVARLTVSDGVNPTLASDITVSVGNAPTATILGPADGSLFRAGDAINYSGSATDTDEGTLPASAFSWTLQFLHDTHVHPAGGPFTNTTTGVLAIPTSGHGFQGSTRYEIVLTVTDSDGLQGTDSVTVFPDKVNLSFGAVPSGLELEIDGIRKQTPFVLDDLKGFLHTITAPDQSMAGTSYSFVSWSDGGNRSHSIVVPESGQAYLATYQAAAPPAGLVAAYGFDEDSGDDFFDSSGNGNTGIISGATRTSAGKYGSALVFDGSGALAIVNDAPSLDLTAEMTLEAWVYPTTLGYWRDVIYKGVDDIYYLEGSTPGGPPAAGASSFSSPLYGSTTLPVGTWSHLAASYDGTTLRLYVNGQEVASRPQSGLIQTSDAPLTIGGDFFYGQYWDGRIDEVRIYNRALSQSEIQQDIATAIGAAAVPAMRLFGFGTLGVGLLAVGLAHLSRRPRRS